MKTNRWMKCVLSTVSTVMVLPILSVLAFGAGLPEQALSHANPRVQEVMAAQEAETPELMAMEDVIGTAVGIDDKGELAIVVYVNQKGKNPAKRVRNIPNKLRGENITVELTEPFHAFSAHTATQAPPIQLGTSGGWSYDMANGYCCGGTLGSLVKVTVGTVQTQYIMSNYHVFEADIISGGNNKISTTGDPIIQPGLIDVRCSASSALNVATLLKLQSLPGSNVDVSLAKVNSTMVSPDGSILEIGPISKITVPAAINQAVKKSGRTTGLTRSKIKGLNATISVTYEKECAGIIAFTKTFKKQIIIDNPTNSFLDAGDSGSLMVADITTNPRAVGLLFAGSSTLAVANPINEVLAFIGGKLKGTATMVGN